MKLKEAFSRLGFTISKQNKPNQIDADAFNSLVEQFTKIEEKTIQDNLLFAKLYAYILGKMSGHYSSVDGANKHLNKLLEQPFETTIKILEMELRAMETRQVFADPFLDIQSPSKLKSTIENYPKLKTKFLACWEYWDNDNVKAHLKSNINLSIQNFKNHV
jgi:hypothetical protein